MPTPWTFVMLGSALAEPYATALLLAVFGVLAGVSVLFSRAVDRLGVPIVLLFLILGMLGGSEGVGQICFDDYAFAVRLGTMALVLILFDGGLNTSMSSIRGALYPASLLATAGVVITAALASLFARAIGLPWAESLLLGAVVSSTDAAAVFAILRGGNLSLKPRVGATLEVESCINDPMAVILTTGIIQVLGPHAGMGWQLLLDLPLQLGVGIAIGLLMGILGSLLLRRVHLMTVGLYPALTLAIAFVSFGVATVAWGSGFLAVYVTAVYLSAAGRLPYHGGLTRVHDAIAWLSQIAMFLTLGLLVTPSQLVPVAKAGLGLALFLTLVARPVAVAACLLPFRFSPREIGYLGWAGLRGAVPIILATFPVLAGVPGSQTIFNIVFFVVVVSSIIPGATVRFMTRKLRLDVPQRPLPPAVLEINSSWRLNGELMSFFIEPSVAVCGAPLKEIEFPPGSAVMLVIRGHELLAARGDTVLEPDDHVYVFFRHEDRPLIELLFGRPEEGANV
jgi:cell volume regulation protein A